MLATNKIKEYKKMLRQVPQLNADKFVNMLYNQFLLIDNKDTVKNYKLIESFKEWCYDK